MLDSLPEPTGRERAASVGPELVAGLIPIAGGALVELARQTLGTSLDQRRQAWAERLVAIVNELGERVSDTEAALARD